MPIAGHPTLNDIGYFPYPQIVEVGDPIFETLKKPHCYTKIPVESSRFKGVSRVAKRADSQFSPVLQMGPFSTRRFLREQPFMPITVHPQGFAGPLLPNWVPSAHSEQWCRLGAAFHNRPYMGRLQPPTPLTEDQLSQEDKLFCKVVYCLLAGAPINPVDLDIMPVPVEALDFGLTFTSPTFPRMPMPITTLGYFDKQMDAILYY